MSPPRFRIHTFGCRVNLAESMALHGGLLAAGGRVSSDAEADLLLVNACAVTGRAERDARRTVRRLRRKNPRACLVVTGCLAERAPDAVARWPGVDRVVPNRGKSGLVAELGGQLGGSDDEPEPWPGIGSQAAVRASGRTRAFVKIQDGCDRACAFCLVPRLRGACRSLSPDRVAAVIAGLAASGTREIVLCGIRLGAYGREHSTSLARLVERLTVAGRSRFRLRLSSVEADELDPDLVAVVAGSERVAPHFHLPMQSGSDRLLRAMGRRYTAAAYAGLVERVARRLPLAGIGSDVIAGFPGETEADFAATCRLVGELPFSYLHVFGFSPRPGTEAAALPDRVPDAVRRERVRELRRIGKEKEREFARRLHGRRERVLILASPSPSGLCGSGVTVAVPVGLAANRLVEMTIDGSGTPVRGEPVASRADEEG